MSKVKSVTIFENGNILVFDEKGKQMPDLQEGWLNFEALRKLAKAIANDGPSIRGYIPLQYDVLGDYVNFYKEHPDVN